MRNNYHILDIPDNQLTETHRLFILYVLRDYLGHDIDFDEFTFFEYDQSFGKAKTKFASIYGSGNALLEFWIVYHENNPSGLAFRFTHEEGQSEGMVQFNIVAINENGVRKLIKDLPPLSEIAKNQLH